MGSEHKVKVAQYLVDTRKLWPGATKTKQLEDEVGFILPLSAPSFLFFSPLLHSTPSLLSLSMLPNSVPDHSM